MFNKFNTKTLIGIFAGLLIIVALIKISDNKKGDRSFRSNVLEIDTSKVTAITINPKSSLDIPVFLTKNDGGWQVKTGNKKYSADIGTINGMLTELNNLVPERIAGTSEETWKKYEVTDSLATKVTLSLGKSKTKELYIGKFSYQQPKSQSPYNFNQQGTMTTYVRVGKDEKVFAVNGFLSMTFNREAKEFRNKVVIKSNKNDWTKLSFTYPDSSFTLVKEGQNWTIGGLQTDSLTTVDYLRNISNLSNSVFVDDQLPMSTNAIYELKIEGDNFAEPIIIKALPADSINQQLITSSINEGIYFSGGKSGLTDKIFVSKNKFLQSIN